MSTDRCCGIAARARHFYHHTIGNRVAGPGRRLLGTGVLLLVASTVAASGCAQVLPIERELLSAPIMELDDDPRGRAAEQHWLETLEASTGGYGGAAGGCACY